MSVVIHGRGIVPGIWQGQALVSRLAIQGWSGVDERTGLVIEPGHPFEGLSIKGKVLVLSGGKGSTGWSCHFHAAKVRGLAPGAMVLPRMDSRTAVAVAVLGVPAVTDIAGDLFSMIPHGAEVLVNGTAGTITLL